MLIDLKKKLEINLNYLVFFYHTLQLYLPPKDSENYSIT